MKFNDTEIEEDKFHQCKNPISINDIDTNKTAVSNKFPFGKQDFKYYIGYKYNKEIRPLCIFFPEMSIYKGYSYQTEKIKKKFFIGKYMTICKKVKNIIKRIFNSELIYNKKYLKAENKFNAKENFQCFHIYQ